MGSTPILEIQTQDLLLTGPALHPLSRVPSLFFLFESLAVGSR